MAKLSFLFADKGIAQIYDPFPLGTINPDWWGGRLEPAQFERAIVDDLDIFNGGSFPNGQFPEDTFSFL